MTGWIRNEERLSGPDNLPARQKLGRSLELVVESLPPLAPQLVGTSAEAVLKFVRSDMDGGFSLDGLVLPAGAAALLFLIISIANLFS